jgi:hypothetical protein
MKTYMFFRILDHNQLVTYLSVKVLGKKVVDKQTFYVQYTFCVIVWVSEIKKNWRYA